MDWRLIIGVVAIGALLAAFLVTRRSREPARQAPDRQQGPDGKNQNRVPQVDPETTRRFLEALKAQS